MFCNMQETCQVGASGVKFQPQQNARAGIQILSDGRMSSFIGENRASFDQVIALLRHNIVVKTHTERDARKTRSGLGTFGGTLLIHLACRRAERHTIALDRAVDLMCEKESFVGGSKLLRTVGEENLDHWDHLLSMPQARIPLGMRAQKHRFNSWGTR